MDSRSAALWLAAVGFLAIALIIWHFPDVFDQAVRALQQ